MEWHLFALLGMMPFDLQTDPDLPNFCNRAKEAIPQLTVHAPVRDYQAGAVAAQISGLPANVGVLVVGTSLGACDVPVVGSYTHHIIDGAFGFQASIFGVDQPFTANVKFAHIFNSDNPFPFPGLGALRWKRGDMTGGLINQPHNIPHPGDYDLNDQNTFIREMARIIAHTSR
jgi:hypothetical protein